MSDPFPDSSENPDDPYSENGYATNEEIDELFDDDPDTPVITEIADPEDIDEIFADDEDPPAPPPVITIEGFVTAVDVDNMFLDDGQEVVPDTSLDPEEYMTQLDVDALFPEPTYCPMSEGDVDVIFMDDDIDLISPMDPVDDRLASADLVEDVFEDDGQEVIPDTSLDPSEYTTKEDVDALFPEEEIPNATSSDVDAIFMDDDIDLIAPVDPVDDRLASADLVEDVFEDDGQEVIPDTSLDSSEYVTTSDIDNMF